MEKASEQNIQYLGPNLEEHSIPPINLQTNSNTRIFYTYKGLHDLYQDQDQNINLYEQNKRDRRQLELLMKVMSNRVFLLNKQHYKTNKKIQETQLQTGKTYWSKSRHEEYIKQKSQLDEVASKFVTETQEQIYAKRVQQRLLKEQQRLRILSAKQKECSEIKKRQKLNEQMIQDYREESKQQNVLKNIYVRQQYQEGNHRIKQYFQTKQRQTQETNQIRAFEEKQRQQNLEEAMKIIEVQETQMFGKLHQTFKVEQNINSELQNAKQMPPNVFLNKTSKTMRRQLSASAYNRRDSYNTNNICYQSLASFYNAAKVSGRQNLSASTSKLKTKGIPSAFTRNYYPKMY